MSLSLKAELEIWAAALDAYDEQDFEKALTLFSRIADSSKILTNMGIIYATIGEHETAVDHFIAATNLDPYLAIAHFQCGVSNFLLQRYDLALLNFEDAYLYLRGNEAINYDQLGLKFKLFSAEIMFNKGLTQTNLGYAEQGMADMKEASRIKVTDEHGVIDEAIRDRGEGYTVFSIPVGVQYRPSENKLKNSKSKDYLGKAKLVAASDSNDAFTEFTGVVKLQQATTEDADNKGDENKNKPDVESSILNRSATVPLPRVDLVAPRPSTLERSKTTLQLGAAIRPDAAALASRRSQSVSNPANAPRPLVSDLSRMHTALGRNNTTRLARNATTNPTGAGVMPLRLKTHQVTASGTVGVDAVDSKANGETGTAGGPTTLRSQLSLWRLRGQGVSPATQPSAPPSRAVSPGQYINTTKAPPPLALPAAPAPMQGEGHLTQFYTTYIDVYADDQTSRPAILRPPTAQSRSNPTSPQRQSPVALFYQQPQPRSQEQQQPPSWMPSASSPVKTSSNANISFATSRAPSRAANAAMTNASSNPSAGMYQNMGTAMGMNIEPTTGVGMNQNMGVGTGGANMTRGGINNPGGGSIRRKVTRRPTLRRVAVYDDDDGDDGFVTGEYEEFEMANIRVKLHYQGDVRGMTIPPTTSLKEFVERVTTKFGTSLTGLGLKFTDEDGMKISLRDEDDFELAIETAREGAKGRSEGKIEVWCVDL